MAGKDYESARMQDAIDNLVAAACGVSHVLANMAAARDERHGVIQAQDAEVCAYTVLSNILFDAARPFYEAEEVAGDAE